MVILYVKGKKAAKLGSRAENCWENKSGKLLVFGFFTVFPFFIVFPVAMAVFGIIRTNLSCPPQILKALCLDVILPGVFRVPIEVLVIDGELRNIIHDALGNLIARFVHTDRRVMDFWRRSGSDQPNAQMFEDGPDNRRIFDAADDPHGALTFRADQRIDLVDFLYQTRPIPAEDFFIPLGFEDTGDDVIAAFLLPLPP